MKCIKCQRDCKFKERSSGKCPRCDYEFVFEPRKGDPFSDAAFLGAINRVSSDGKVAWGAEHLRHDLNKRSLSSESLAKSIPKFFLLLFFSFALIHNASMSRLNFLIIGFVGLLIVIVIKSMIKRGPRLSEREFAKLFDRWRKINKDPKGLIVRSVTAKPLRGSEPDLAEYSFDRAVICDRARTADLLIANNFHFENNCAVLAARGYPESIFLTVKTMLLRNPKLKVFVLHDATPEGCALAYKLAHDDTWFKGRAQVIDVGLRPAQAASLKTKSEKVRVTVNAGHGINAEEAAWLCKNALELAVIRPEQVIKRLFLAISSPVNKASAKEYEKREGYLVDRTSFLAQATASDGGGDSFG